MYFSCQDLFAFIGYLELRFISIWMNLSSFNVSKYVVLARPQTLPNCFRATTGLKWSLEKLWRKKGDGICFKLFNSTFVYISHTSNRSTHLCVCVWFLRKCLCSFAYTFVYGFISFVFPFDLYTRCTCSEKWILCCQAWTICSTIWLIPTLDLGMNITFNIFKKKGVIGINTLIH